MGDHWYPWLSCGAHVLVDSTNGILREQTAPQPPKEKKMNMFKNDKRVRKILSEHSILYVGMYKGWESDKAR